jgi:hypothetical protein
MNSDDVARQLHDQATRGAVLSAAEQERLEAWYAQQDQAEGTLLAGAPSPTLAVLQAQVNDALAQLVTLTQHLQTLAAENNNLRCEVAALQRQLAQKRVAQPA